MAQHINQSTKGESPLIIGQGMIVRGIIHSRADVFVNGEVEGELDVENNTLTIGPSGKVVASARARELEIQGIITGDVETTGTTSIRESGQLFGDVKTGGIVIESGAVLKGKVEIVAKSQRNPEVTHGE